MPLKTSSIVLPSVSNFSPSASLGITGSCVRGASQLHNSELMAACKKASSVPFSTSTRESDSERVKMIVTERSMDIAPDL